MLYHGWPNEWVHSAPKFEKVSEEAHTGYRLVKLRYEVVPGLWSVALLYEPEHMTGKIPAILNVNGHGPGGKAVEHKQKRCINQARRGILALSIEWFSFGELAAKGNDHSDLRLLDLAGENGAGLFYLEMRRGLDYLYDHPNVDRARIGATGLSGGGWQTITLSALDPRVGAAVPVAGFATLTTAIEQPHYTGADPEQNASDSRQGIDYAQLAAMRAPRPHPADLQRYGRLLLPALTSSSRESTTTSSPSMNCSASPAISSGTIIRIPARTLSARQPRGFLPLLRLRLRSAGFGYGVSRHGL